MSDRVTYGAICDNCLTRFTYFNETDIYSNGVFSYCSEKCYHEKEFEFSKIILRSQAVDYPE